MLLFILIYDLYYVFYCNLLIFKLILTTYVTGLCIEWSLIRNM
jgi:hypothetical protein